MTAPIERDYSEFLPPLSTDEFAALQADIKKHGVITPIDVDEHGTILDGHHRVKINKDAKRRVIGKLSEGEKQAHVFRANLARRNLSPEQRAALLKRTKATAELLRKEGRTQEQTAALLGVARETVRDWFTHNGGNAITCKPDVRVKVSPKAHADICDRIESGKSQAQVAADYSISQQHVSRIHNKERKQREKQSERQEAVKQIGGDTLGVHHGDFRELGTAIADDSVDLIFTDPPYATDDETIALYGDIAEFGARVLRPGGWCLCYAGMSSVLDILQGLTKHLSWGWMFAVIHGGGNLRFRKYRLQNAWKPIFGVYKPPLNVWWDWFSDAVSGGKEKEDHKWQQAESEAAHFIEALTPANGVVVDCCVGSGTTLAAAKKLKRQPIGFDIDENAVTTARLRLKDTK